MYPNLGYINKMYLSFTKFINPKRSIQEMSFWISKPNNTEIEAKISLLVARIEALEHRHDALRRELVSLRGWCYRNKGIAMQESEEKQEDIYSGLVPM